LILEGVFPPMITPFKKNEEVDIEKLTEYLDFLIKGGVHGIFLLGTNGEGPLLTFEEKKEIIKVAVEHIGEQVPVIAGTGCISTKETIELSKYAERVGADAVHIVTPYYYPISGEGLIRHYNKISESIEIPIIIYYIPERTGVKIDVNTLMKLAGNEKIIGIKDSSKSVEWFYEAINNVRSIRKDFVFLGGSDALIYTHLSLGANGVVSAVANVFPEIVVELYEEFKKGNFKRAKEIQDKILLVRRALKAGPYLGGVKAALKLRGLDFGDPRSPLVGYNEEEMERLKERLKEIGVIP